MNTWRRDPASPEDSALAGCQPRDRGCHLFATRSLFTVLVCLLMLSSAASAQNKPIVGLRMELMSIRNRSSGPLPVHIKLEYNQMQILEGDLELAIYDGGEFYSRDDLLATYRQEGIALSGRDRELNIVLPPLRTAVNQNWAVEAYFVTKDERIPLSSLPDRPVPPEAHDLLTTSPLERGVLLCSCSPDPKSSLASANRRFLELALSLDNYNPIHQQFAELEGVGVQSIGQSQAEKIGRTIICFSGQWSSRDLPQDPLSYCAFDLVLLSDGALPKLTSEQLDGLTKWVRAGGSLCVLPDAPMKPQYLNFLRTLFESGVENPANLTLDSEGRLLVVSDQPEPIIFSRFGLGRAVLLPDVENLEQRLSKEDLGSVVAFLWKVRKDQPVWKGELWSGGSLVEELRSRGIHAEQDERGIYVTDQSELRYGFYGGQNIDGRFYLRKDQIRSVFGLDDRLSPKTEPLLTLAEEALLPFDVEMVPTWVIGLILSGYVLTIGPVDYFVLGWLRMRKYTWVLFPVVTLAFTFLTITVANAYMGSEDTGGKLVITDLVDDGIAARETVLETLYVGSRSEIVSEHKAKLLVQAEDSFTAADWQAMYGQGTPRQADAPLSYSGHFPQNYSVTQLVQQWSPVSLRSLSLEPEGVTPPPIDWSDVSLITTSEGRTRIVNTLRAEAAASGNEYYAVIYHQQEVHDLLGGYTDTESQERNRRIQFGYNPARSRPALVQQMFSFVPTRKVADQSYFRLVSQVSPEGAGSLEDLAFLDESDPTQWALVVMKARKDEFHVFRKLYVVEPESF